VREVRAALTSYYSFLTLWLVLLAFVPNAQAHETRPAYLEISETAPGRYDVLWRTPVLSGMRLPVVLQFAEGTRDVTAPAVAGAYLRHGIEHILLGYDHLLFVFALILIVRSTRVLVWTITAFTLAHSITLALATLGVVHVPGPPVEATIALSILLLACEIVRLHRGEASFTARWPWLVAFSFGLLHGLGFASALANIGLPRGDVLLALFAFNVGVELGQLAFIAVVLGLFALAKRIRLVASFERHARPAATYAIGILASFWFFERLAGFRP
jgi:hydrogenase/urease accessory protein HupE